jgi:hypothetical protein
MLVESKSNLARLMATENLLVEQRNVPTASFDLKSRILTVPILNGNLSSHLYDLLLGHEVGHALETPEQGWHDSIIDLKVDKSILNVCEDVRIEKKIKRKFPGIRVSFLKGYQELMEMDFFKTKGKKINEYNLIDRINLYSKGGPSQGIEFNDEEAVLLKEVELTETFPEVVEVARKIQEFMKEEIRQHEKQEAQKKLIIEITDDAPTEECGEVINPDDFDEVEIVDKRTKPNTMTDPGASSKESMYDYSKTDKSFREKEITLYDDKKKEMVYANIPELQLENIIVQHEEMWASVIAHNKHTRMNKEKLTGNYNKFRQESNKVVSYLVKEFEMHKNATQMVRSKTSKTGEIDMSRLYNYKFTDDIFKRMTKTPNGKSHGLVMFVDWSGSMQYHINDTIKQVLNLTMFCKKVNIPFEVYALSSYSRNDFYGNYHKTIIQNAKVGDAVLNPFMLLNLLSSKMSTRSYNTASSMLLDFGSTDMGKGVNYTTPVWMHLSGTPLNETVIAAFQIVPEFKKKNNLEIVNTVLLTDGDGSAVNNRADYVDMYGKVKVSSSHTGPKTRIFFRDPITKSSIEVKETRYSSIGSQQTICLLKLLKQRLDSNIVGFYICKPAGAREVLMQYGAKDVDQQYQDFRLHGHTQMNDVGYDEYYIIKSDKMGIDDVQFQVVNNTTKSLVSAFTKYTGNKVSNRVVLTRFIKLIA